MVLATRAVAARLQVAAVVAGQAAVVAGQPVDVFCCHRDNATASFPLGTSRRRVSPSGHEHATI